MGIDLLGFSFDAEKQFRVRLDIAKFIERTRTADKSDATVQELFDWLAENILQQRGAVPADAWDRFLKELRKVAWDLKKSDEILSDQFLLADLGLTG